MLSNIKTEKDDLLEEVEEVVIYRFCQYYGCEGQKELLGEEVEEVVS